MRTHMRTQANGNSARKGETAVLSCSVAAAAAQVRSKAGGVNFVQPFCWLAPPPKDTRNSMENAIWWSVSLAALESAWLKKKYFSLPVAISLLLLGVKFNPGLFSNFIGTSWRFLFSHALFGLPRSPLGLPVSLLGSTGDQTSGSGFYFPGLTPYAEFPHASFADFLSVFFWSRPRSRSRYNAARSRGNRQRHFSGTKTEAERKRHTN